MIYDNDTYMRDCFFLNNLYSCTTNKVYYGGSEDMWYSQHQLIFSRLNWVLYISQWVRDYKLG